MARNVDEYEELAVRLALCSGCLAQVRQRLVDQRGQVPLFNTQSWLAAWERGLLALADLDAALDSSGGQAASNPIAAECGLEPGPKGDRPGLRGVRRWHLVVADKVKADEKVKLQ